MADYPRGWAVPAMAALALMLVPILGCGDASISNRTPDAIIELPYLTTPNTGLPCGFDGDCEDENACTDDQCRARSRSHGCSASTRRRWSCTRPRPAAPRDVVKKAYSACLRVAAENGFSVIAMPALGAGTGGPARDKCARLFSEAIHDHAQSHDVPQVVVVVLYNGVAAADLFAQAVGTS